MANELQIEIVVDDGKAKKTFKTFEAEAEKSGDKAGKSFSDGFGNGLAGLTKTVGLITAAVAAVAGAISLKKAIEEATSAEKALNQFNTSLALAGNYSKEASDKFIAYADSLSKLTGIEDDLIIQNASLLASIGKLSGEGLNKATKAALDLSAGLQIDVGTAFDMVTKASQGNVAGLSKWGIKVDQSLPKTEQFADALNKINAAFGGLSESKINTFEGATNKLTNSFNDFLKAIGELIVKSPFLREMIKITANLFDNLAEKIKNFGAGKDIIFDLTMQLLDLAKVVNNYVTPVFELIYNVGKIVFNGLAALVAFFVDITVGAFQKIAGWLAPFSETAAQMQTELGVIKQATESTLAEMSTNATQSLSDIYNFDFTAATDNLIVNMQTSATRINEAAAPLGDAIANNLIQPINEKLPPTWDMIVNGFNNAFSRSALLGEQFRVSLQNKLNSAFTSFRDGFAGAFASIGQALVKGENVLGAFGKAVLGLFGDLAIQLGQFYFLSGLAAMWLNPAVGAGQIAGGIALTVLGGALKALAGGGGGAAGAPAGGGGGASSGGGGIAASGVDNLSTAKSEPEKRSMGNQINLNVQGNILDRRETGLELANIINDSFGANGTAIPSGALA